MYDFRPKVKDPITIVLGKKDKKLMFGETREEEYPLDPGIILETSHYGFIIITEKGIVQEEILYPTECNINAIGMRDGKIEIYEEGKRKGWLFDSNGVLCRSIIGEEIDGEYFESKTYLDMTNSEMKPINGEPLVKNPVRIEVDPETYHSNVVVYDPSLEEERCPLYQDLKQKEAEHRFPVYPGVVLGTEHYGFTLVVKTKEGVREKTYPTQNPINGIAAQGNAKKIQIFEEGKYHPWTISAAGELEGEAHYEPCSRRDMAYMKEQLRILEEENVIQKIKK